MDKEFDKDDLTVFINKLGSPSGIKDYSRWDLNGDGYTGGDNRARFNLNIDYLDNSSPTTGKSQYSEVSQIMSSGQTVSFDETEVTDGDVLCYYAHSELYKNEDRGGLVADLGGFCKYELTKVVLQVNATDPRWNGLPATIELTDLTAAAPNGRTYSPTLFQIYGTGNIGCPDGERGGPIFSAQVDLDTSFFAARISASVPSTVSGPSPNRPPCSSFVAFRLGDPKTEEVWINGTTRAARFGSFIADWEYQVRFYSGDPADGFKTKQCEVGVVPNSGNWAPSFNASSCTYKLVFEVL